MRSIKKGPEEKIAKNGYVFDYPLGKKLGVAVQVLNGRVPDSGAYRNTVCSETCLLLSGTATIFINDAPFHVKKGEVIVINPKEKSYLIAKKVKMITITVPDWYPAQCKNVRE